MTYHGEEYEQIKNTEDLLDRDVMIKRVHGFSDAIIDNAENVANIGTDFSTVADTAIDAPDMPP